MFVSSHLPSMLLLPVAFCTSIYKHECDLNIGGGEGAYVIVCYNICDRDCSCYSEPVGAYVESVAAVVPQSKNS